jgi:hypothetical protein
VKWPWTRRRRATAEAARRARLASEQALMEDKQRLTEARQVADALSEHRGMADGEPVVVYARGTEEEIARQQETCRAAAQRKGQRIVAVTWDDDDHIDGWCDAEKFVSDGIARCIKVASRAMIPDVVESVTSELSGRRPRRTIRPDRIDVVDPWVEPAE